MDTAADLGPRFDAPARYRIRVRGQLDASWSDRLCDLAISVDAERHVTRLEGDLADQAALAGVLATLNDLQLPLLDVTLLDLRDEQPEPRHMRTTR